MIAFNEGLPGAGKSYDAVAQHIVPALKKGRTVYARLNGLDIEAIARYIGQTPASVATMLHLVEPDDVHKLAERVTQDALVIIDECHEFYVASREPLPPEQERFFAIHRHLGLDIVLISQFYKRVHSAVRARIERKNLFRKLTAFGMNNHYACEFWAATQPDNFEKIGSERRKYDSNIFPLYKSVQAGTENMETYDGGGRNILKGKLGFLTVLMVLGLAWGVWYLSGWFEEDFVPEQKVQLPKVEKPPTAVKTGATSISTQAPIVPEKPKRDAPIQYVLDLLVETRPRVSASMVNQEGKTFGYVEFVDQNGRVLDRLSFQNLRDLGFSVSVRSYGIEAQSGDDKWVATAWPQDFPNRYTQRDRDSISSSAAVPSASERQPHQRSAMAIITDGSHASGPTATSGSSSQDSHRAKWGNFRLPASK